MIATYTTIATLHSAKVSPRRQSGIQRQPALDLSALASAKLRSKLVAVVDETRSDFQNAESEQNLAYLFAICFHKLLNVAKSQFEAEDNAGYFAFRSSHLDKQTSKTIAKLSRQHTGLLRSLREMLETAEGEIRQTRNGVQDAPSDNLGLLNRFLSFQKELRQHERDEHKLLDGPFGYRIRSVA